MREMTILTIPREPAYLEPGIPDFNQGINLGPRGPRAPLNPGPLGYRPSGCTVQPQGSSKSPPNGGRSSSAAAATAGVNLGAATAGFNLGAATGGFTLGAAAAGFNFGAFDLGASASLAAGRFAAPTTAGADVLADAAWWIRSRFQPELPLPLPKPGRPKPSPKKPGRPGPVGGGEGSRPM